MTKAKNREEWFIAWKREAEHLTRAYQCKADPDVFDKLTEKIKDVVAVIFEISNLMEAEGTWTPASFEKIKRAYQEAKNCGYMGTIVEYCLKVGVTLEDLEDDRRRPNNPKYEVLKE